MNAAYDYKETMVAAHLRPVPRLQNNKPGYLMGFKLRARDCQPSHRSMCVQVVTRWREQGQRWAPPPPLSFCQISTYREEDKKSMFSIIYRF